MNDKSDGMNYAPKGKPSPVVGIGDFCVAAVGLDHGHIYGMINGLTEAGATVKSVYDPDPAKVAAFIKAYPQAHAASSEEELFADKTIALVASACVTSERAALGIRAMNAGKDYFTDKAPLTTLEQLSAVKETCTKTGRKYMVYYSERLHVESAVYAGELIGNGVIGKVIQTIGIGPHRLNAPSRPGWFFELKKYGGILCDIGSHQVEQFLYYTGNTDAQVINSTVGNYNNKNFPELNDFGDANMLGDNGATGYFRVDWFTPDGLSSWGDGRLFILGTEGYIELRKYLDVTRTASDSYNVYFADRHGEHRFNANGNVGYPFFGQLILDCLNRTENAMTQAHAFKAAELCVIAQMKARKL